MTYLTWEKDVDGTYHAFNDKDERLGWLSLERVGTWMHWCWYQREEYRMSPGCLEEVRNKQRELKRKK